MELALKIFETLGITPLAVLQMAITVTLAVILSAILIRPVLQVFQERENRSSKPMEESKALLTEAEGKTRQYEEAVRRSTSESIARKRAKIEEASRAERKRIEEAAEESNRQVEQMKSRIGSEKEEALTSLRQEVARLSTQIAEKVLGRSVA